MLWGLLVPPIQKNGEQNLHLGVGWVSSIVMWVSAFFYFFISFFFLVFINQCLFYSLFHLPCNLCISIDFYYFWFSVA